MLDWSKLKGSQMKITRYSNEEVFLNCLPNDKRFDLSKMKAFADDEIDVT